MSPFSMADRSMCGCCVSRKSRRALSSSCSQLRRHFFSRNGWPFVTVILMFAIAFLLHFSERSGQLTFLSTDCREIAMLAQSVISDVFQPGHNSDAGSLAPFNEICLPFHRLTSFRSCRIPTHRKVTTLGFRRLHVRTLRLHLSLHFERRS